MSQCCQCETGTPPPPPPTGACCYGPFGDRLCIDDIYGSECSTYLYSVFYPGLTCSHPSVDCDIIETCFIADSLVSMADGSFKQISKVQIGEKVISTDNNINTVIGIEKTKLGNRKLASINNSEFFFSYDHPILTKDGFKSFNHKLSQRLYKSIDFVGDLQIGDLIYIDGNEVIVFSLQVKDADPNLELYDLSLDGNHIYFVNNIAFHNCVFSYWCCVDDNGSSCSNTYPFGCQTNPFIVGDCNNCNTTTTTTTTSTTPCPCPYVKCGCVNGAISPECPPGEYLICETCECVPNEPIGCCLENPYNPGIFECSDMDPSVCESLGGSVLGSSCVDAGPEPCGTTTTTSTTPCPCPYTDCDCPQALGPHPSCSPGYTWNCETCQCEEFITTTTTLSPEAGYYCIQCLPENNVYCTYSEVAPGPFYDCFIAGGPYETSEDCALNCTEVTTTTTAEPTTEAPTLEPTTTTTTTTDQPTTTTTTTTSEPTTTTEPPAPIGCCYTCYNGNLDIIGDMPEDQCSWTWYNIPCALLDVFCTTTDFPTSPPE